MIYTADLTELRYTKIKEYFRNIAEAINPEHYFNLLSRSQQLDCIDFLVQNDFADVAEKLNILIR
jgi:hypothetical protein